jgi:hypothetical protein
MRSGLVGAIGICDGARRNLRPQDAIENISKQIRDFRKEITTAQVKEEATDATRLGAFSRITSA